MAMQSSESQNPPVLKNPALDMEKWRSLVNAWDASKENQKDYCQRLGISLNTFTYVRGKLIKQDKNTAQPPFVPITLSRFEEQNNPRATTLLLENPNGLKLHISLSLSLEQLIKIFKLAGWQHD
jgi:hypothetical protein